MNRKEKTIGDKIVTVLTMVCSVAIIVLALLQLTGVWESAIYVFEPLMGVVMLLQAYRCRKNQRSVAILSLCTAVFIFIVAGVIFFLR